MRVSPLFLIALTGCDLFGTVRPSGRPMAEAHGGPAELRILDIESPLRAQKKIPLLSTPEVFAAYVPSHTERDLLIGEHWLFFKLRDAEWYVERLQDPDPPASGDAPEAVLLPLRELDWSKVVVPHRGNP